MVRLLSITGVTFDEGCLARVMPDG